MQTYYIQKEQVSLYITISCKGITRKNLSVPIYQLDIFQGILLNNLSKLKATLDISTSSYSWSAFNSTQPLLLILMPISCKYLSYYDPHCALSVIYPISSAYTHRCLGWLLRVGSWDHQSFWFDWYAFDECAIKPKNVTRVTRVRRIELMSS